MSSRTLCYFIIIGMLFGCRSTEKIIVPAPVITKTPKPKKTRTKTVAPKKKSFEEVLVTKLTTSADFSQHFSGLVVYDPERQKVLVDHNADRFFTPASNIKLFTFYTCLKVLEDEIPFFSYMDRPEGLYIKANGNPSFLHPYLEFSNEAYHFLKKYEKDIYLDMGIFEDEALGDGWAWEDATLGYQCEKTAFPVYGNLMCVMRPENEQTFHMQPSYFQSRLQKSSDDLRYPKRNKDSNHIAISDSISKVKRIETDIPIKFDDHLCYALLSDTLNRKVIRGSRQGVYKKAMGTNVDNLFEKMMKESDNMISEQLLLHASHELFDTMGSRRMITYALDSLMPDLKHRPRWVDGSGLSRYNLATPYSFVQVLDKIRRRLPKEKLEFYLPKLKLTDSTGVAIPLFAKSGSLSNNYNLSGYMECASGRQVIFSFMNNHYRHSRKQMIKALREVLVEIHSNY